MSFSTQPEIIKLKITDWGFLDDLGKAVRQHHFDAYLQLISSKVATIMTTEIALNRDSFDIASLLPVAFGQVQYHWHTGTELM